MIHIGDHSYQIGDGEKLPYHISLVRVTDTGVYLKQGGKLLFLEIGKTLRAAIPVKENGNENSLPQNPAPNSESGGTRCCLPSRRPIAAKYGRNAKGQCR